MTVLSSALTDQALAGCADEPIRVPGAIQPYGVLLVMDELTMVVEGASANAAELFGQDVAGLAVDDLVDRASADLVRAFSSGDLAMLNPLRLRVRGVDVDVVAHRSDDLLVTEWEPVAGARQAGVWHRRLPSVLQRLAEADTLAELATILVADVRALTGYDRVMLYRFDLRGEDGEVIAEDRRADLDPFLGLRYPAADIPVQARALYLDNWLRIIPDARYEPVPILSSRRNEDEDEGEEPLDLSHALLRSVSPVHLEYLANMGVRSSMSVSVVDRGRLWGLIACHHYEGPHRPSYEDRSAASFLGRTASSLLPALQRSERSDAVLRVATQQVAIASALGRNPRAPRTVLADDASSMFHLLPASGAAMRTGGQLMLFGRTPGGNRVQSLVSSLLATGTSSTDALSTLVPGAESDSETASGLLAVGFGTNGDFLAWFRGEVLREVTWAGDPTNAKIVMGEQGSRLSPRDSFAAWVETIRDTSTPWETHELEAAHQLSHHLTELALRRADEDNRLAVTLQRTLLLEDLPAVSGIALAARYLPASHDVVGGDWYDLVPMPSGHVILVIGDVAGHGLGAAAITAQVRHGLRAYLLRDRGPAAALTALNMLMTSLLPQELATAIVVDLNPRTGSGTVARAGHPPALLITSSAATFVEGGAGPVLGLASAAAFSEVGFTLGGTDRLVLFTDGLIENRRADVDEALDSLAAAAASHHDASLDALLDSLLAATHPTDSDDVTLLAVAMQSGTAAHTG